MPHQDSWNLWDPGSDFLTREKTICRRHPVEKRKSRIPSGNWRNPHLQVKSSGSQIFLPWNLKWGRKNLKDTCSFLLVYIPICCCCSLVQSCLTLCDLMTCSTPGFPVLHHVPEFTQTRIHWFSDAIQPSHPLSIPSPAFNLSQHQCLFQWVSSSISRYNCDHNTHQSYFNCLSIISHSPLYCKLNNGKD